VRSKSEVFRDAGEFAAHEKHVDEGLNKAGGEARSAHRREV
jgi:hypothetical protein